MSGPTNIRGGLIVGTITGSNDYILQLADNGGLIAAAPFTSTEIISISGSTIVNSIAITDISASNLQTFTDTTALSAAIDQNTFDILVNTTNINSLSGAIDAIEQEATIIIGGDGLSSLESPVNTYTINVTADYATTSLVADVSGGLDSRIDTLESIDHSQYHLEIDAGNISAGLDGRLDTLEAIDHDQYSTTIVVAGISGDLDNRLDILELIDHDSYATTIVVSGISGDLQTQINNIEQESTIIVGGDGLSSVESPANTWTVNVTADYAMTSLVADVSGSLDGRLDTLEAIDHDTYATNITVATISSGLDSRIDTLESIDHDLFHLETDAANISAGLDSRIDILEAIDHDQYATTIVVAGISGDLQTQIDNIEQEATVIVGGDGLSSVESPANTWTVNVTADYATTSLVADVSGGLDSRLDTLELIDHSQYHLETDAANISAGLDTRLDTLEGATHVNTLNGFSGGVTIAEGDNITINSVANVITITAAISGGGTDHNTLANLQGGGTGEYYHLTESQVGNITGGPFVSIAGDTMTGNLTIVPLSGAVDNVLTVNSSGTIIDTGIAVADVTGGGSSNHNSLIGLQGGTTGEFYHLTVNEYSGISGSGKFVKTSGDVMTGQLDISGANIVVTNTGAHSLFSAIQTDGLATTIGTNAVNAFVRYDDNGGLIFQTQPRADIEAQNENNTTDIITLFSNGDVSVDVGNFTVSSGVVDIQADSTNRVPLRLRSSDSTTTDMLNIYGRSGRYVFGITDDAGYGQNSSDHPVMIIYGDASSNTSYIAFGGGSADDSGNSLSQPLVCLGGSNEANVGMQARESMHGNTVATVRIADGVDGTQTGNLLEITDNSYNPLTFIDTSGDVTVSTLSVSGSEIITVDSNGKLKNSGVTIEDISGGAGISHNVLSTLQGGTSNEYYHLTQGQHDDYIGRIEVSSISGGLDSRLDSIEAASYVNTIEGLSGTIDISGGKDIVISSTSGIISISSTGLNSTEGDSLYVNVAGDTMTGALTISDSTSSTSPSNGAVVVTGGVGIGGGVNIGGDASINGDLSVVSLSGAAGNLLTIDSNGKMIDTGIASSTSSSRYTQSFTDGSLVGGVLDVAHNLNNKFVIISVYNDTDFLIVPDSIEVVDISSANIDLTKFRKPIISGTWNIVVIG